MGIFADVFYRWPLRIEVEEIKVCRNVRVKKQWEQTQTRLATKFTTVETVLSSVKKCLDPNIMHMQVAVWTKDSFGTFVITVRCLGTLFASVSFLC